jgi:hypothetical protein
MLRIAFAITGIVSFLDITQAQTITATVSDNTVTQSDCDEWRRVLWTGQKLPDADQKRFVDRVSAYPNDSRGIAPGYSIDIHDGYSPVGSAGAYKQNERNKAAILH